jgi:phage terminase large subunit-like protein
MIAPNVSKADLLKALEAEACKRSLAYFVEATTRDTWGNPIQLHDWQRNHFIPILGHEPKGRRVRFHAPPQYGKSIIMSKRFPLWLMVNNPLLRVVIVTYNEDFAAGFYDALRSAVHEVSQVVPGFELTGNISAGLVTKERAAINDGTRSIVFATIGTGFTGKGCDVVIIDDPYRGLEDAMSPAYRKTVESFFDNKLFPRINEQTDIYLMYHAWAQGDIGDYAVTKYGFTPYRFAAIADGGENDPTGREVGELLSPMRTVEHLESLEAADPKMYAAMYQGLPIADGDRPIRTDGIKVLPVHLCPSLDGWYRGWDTAYTSKTGSDHTATLRVAFDADGNIHIRGFRKERVPFAQITDWAASIATSDPAKTYQVVEMHNAGYAVADYLKRQDGIAPWVINQRVAGPEGKLRVRLVEFINLAYARKVFVYQEGDCQKFVDECEMFTGLIEGESDDLLASLAVILLAIKGEESKPQQLDLSKNPYAPRMITRNAKTRRF